MSLQNLFAHIQWIPAVVMTLFSFAIGMLWHQQFLFGKTWAKENNPGNVQKKMNLPLMFGGTAVMHFVAIAGNERHLFVREPLSKIIGNRCRHVRFFILRLRPDPGNLVISCAYLAEK